MLKCIDRFHSELQFRSTAIKEVADMFEVVQSKSLLSAISEEEFQNWLLSIMSYPKMIFERNTKVEKAL